MWKKSDPTDIWAWVHKDLEKQHQKGGLAQTMVENYIEFNDLMNNDHLGAEMAIAQALEAAKTLGETKWELHLRHWRLQLWLKHRQTRRALPEAIDLLELATDRRVKDVPQRICAYHDVVECYLDIDRVGYYQEIVDNSKDILAQLPQRHCCATCARSHLAETSAAVGKTDEAIYWLNQTKATMTERRHSGLVIGFGKTSELIDKLEDAELFYQEARNLAREKEQQDHYIDATLSLARVLMKRGKTDEAFAVFQEARQISKYNSSAGLLALQMEVKGHLAEHIDEKESASDAFAHAARIYTDLGAYRDAADNALHALEIMRTAGQSLEDTLLALAAHAVGQLPATSQDLYARLATFNREPVTATRDGQDTGTYSAEEQQRKELATLHELLEKNSADQNFSETSLLLFRIGRWHSMHDEQRSAVDYLIWNALLERLMQRPMDEREDALGALKRLQEQLPEGTVEAALEAQHNGPPPLLETLLADLPLNRWRWVVRAITAEIADQPFVEPEPEDEEDGEQQMNEWMSHVLSMSALIVRFYDKVQPEEFRPWIENLEKHHSGLSEQVAKIPEEGHEADHEYARTMLSFLAGLQDLAQGKKPAEVKATVYAPFDQAIEQVGEIAEQPVWFHPEASPLDFLVEQAAQKAVRAIRLADEHRPNRLKNLALRYRLMNFDLREEEPLLPIARFLDALAALVIADGKHLPTVPLEAPFDGILAAVYEAGQEKPADASQPSV